MADNISPSIITGNAKQLYSPNVQAVWQGQQAANSISNPWIGTGASTSSSANGGNFWQGLNNFLSNPIGSSLTGGLLGSVTSGIIGGIQQNKQNKFNAEQAQLSREWSANEAQLGRDFEKEMWNAQNEYNTPQAQLQRLMDAGINPSTAVGMMSGNNPAGNAGNASAPSIGSTVPATSSSVGDIGSTVGQIVAGVPDSIYSNMVREQDRVQRKLDSMIKEVDLKYAEENWQKNMELLGQNIEQTKVNIENGEYDVKLKQVGLSREQVQLGIDINNWAMSSMDVSAHQEFLNLGLRIQRAEALLGETRAQFEKQVILQNIATMQAQMCNLYANAALAGAQTAGVNLDNQVKIFDVSKLGDRYQREVEGFNQSMRNAKTENTMRVVDGITGSICQIGNLALDVTGAVMTGGASAALRSMTKHYGTTPTTAVKDIYRGKQSSFNYNYSSSSPLQDWNP